jgi:CubicO group peptidase (beta-lactamase class C family)
VTGRTAASATLALGVCWLAASLLGMAALARADGAASGSSGSKATRIEAIARRVMRQNDLRAVILNVGIGDREVVTTALGNSMTGVSATTRMHFRIGNVAIAYMATALLRLQDQHRVNIDDRVSRWFPRLPGASRITLRMLANSTSGYSDYVANPSFVDALYADPFRSWTPRELIRIGTSKIDFPPGSGFRYSHTGFVILGEVLSKLTREPLARLIRENIVAPLRLRDTNSSQTPQIPTPVLHAFTRERGNYEDSTFWSPSWGTARGANMTSNIVDVARSARAIGAGSLLSPSSYREQVGSRTVGLDGNTKAFHYGMGVIVQASWIVENPSLAGFGVEAAYLPAKKITIAVVSTKRPGSEIDPNYSELIARQIATYLAPAHPIPLHP